MKYILTLLCFGVLSAYGQEPAYTPMRLNYQFRGIKVDSLFLIPSFNDTTAANSSTMKNVAGAMIRTGNDFYMRNATTNAWLQNVNVGTGASPSVQFVDSIWRVAGKDSIFWRKGGVSNKIKDSAGLADSPDRIDGSATGKVTSAFASQDFDINSVNLFTLQANTYQITTGDFSHTSGQMFFQGAGTKGHNILLDTNLYRITDNSGTILLRMDTLGNFEAGDLTKDSLTFSLVRSGNEIILKSKATPVWKEQNNGFSMYLKVTRGANGIDLTGGNYTARVPGVYVIADATSSDFVIPDATAWPGQTITIINTDADPANLTCGNNLYDKGTGGTINSIATTEMIIFVSDGSDWYGAIQ